jgi:hypothetical protein
MSDQKADTVQEFDEHIGAVEGDRATDPQGGNPHGTGLDDQGMPNDPVATCEDVLGANLDGTEGG